MRVTTAAGTRASATAQAEREERAADRGAAFLLGPALPEADADASFATVQSILSLMEADDQWATSAPRLDGESFFHIPLRYISCESCSQKN